MEPAEILALPMGPNDAGVDTVRDYLKALLLRVWTEEEGFSGKRPFGNSGWKNEVYDALIRGGAGGASTILDSAAGCDRLIAAAINSL